MFSMKTLPIDQDVPQSAEIIASLDRQIGEGRIFIYVPALINVNGTAMLINSQLIRTEE